MPFHFTLSCHNSYKRWLIIMAIPLRKCLSSFGIFPVFRNPTSVISFLLPNHIKHHFSSGKPQIQEVVPDYRKIEDEMSKEVFAKVNDQISKDSYGRLFAVVHVQGSQFKVTKDDIIIMRHFWGPTLGDQVRLEKVLLVGCSDFTLIGRPLLPLDQVSVIGTVIEKTLSHIIPFLKYKPRKNNLKQHFYKDELTFLRINSINLLGKVNELGDTDGLRDRIF